jgi:hypothetical protein
VRVRESERDYLFKYYFSFFLFFPTKTNNKNIFYSFSFLLQMDGEDLQPIGDEIEGADDGIFISSVLSPLYIFLSEIITYKNKKQTTTPSEMRMRWEKNGFVVSPNIYVLSPIALLFICIFNVR